MKKRLFLSSLAAFFCVTGTALAVSPPDAGIILREMERQMPQAPQPVPAPQIEPSVPAAPASTGPRVFIKVIRIAGATVFKEKDLLKLVEGYKGREVTYGELEQAARTIAGHYTGNGFLVKVTFPPQDISEGIVLMYLVEGKLGDVKVDASSTANLRAERAKQYVTDVQAHGTRLTIDNLERSVLLLNDLPGVAANSTLEPGAHQGYADVVLKLSATPKYEGDLTLDNAGDRSSGEYRLTGGFLVNNPFGIGDQVAVRALSSIDNNYVRVGYSVPVGTRGLRLGTSFSYMHYELTGDFRDQNGRGDAMTTGVNLSYPLIRSRNRNVTLSTSYDYRQFYDTIRGATTDDKDLHVGSMGVMGDRQDGFFGGGYISYAAALVIGGLDRSGAPADRLADAMSAKSGGVYAKFQANLSRLQNVADRTTFFAGVSSQFAIARNLDSSERFTLGGLNGIRAYPSSEGSGDHGILITAELRRNLSQRLQVSAFYDFGWTQLHYETWDRWNSGSNTPNDYILQGAGVSASYVLPHDVWVKGTIATRLGDNPGHLGGSNNDSDGTRRIPRFWLQVNKHFN